MPIRLRVRDIAESQGLTLNQLQRRLGRMLVKGH